MPKISMAKVQAMVAKGVTKVMGKRLANMPLERQVDLAHKFIGAATMPTIRRELLGDSGLALDIQDMLKSGKTSEEIKAFYWDCQYWREFWEKTLELEEGMLDLIIEQEVKKVLITP